MEAPLPSCILCSNLLQSPFLSVPVCQSCSFQVISSQFSANKFSPLFGVIDLHEDLKSSEFRIRDVILAQNPLKNPSFYENIENRRENQDQYLEDFFNISLFQQELKDSQDFIFLTYAHSLLVKYNFESNSLESLSKLNGLKAENKFSQVYLNNGIAFLLDWKKDVNFEGENLNYLIFNKNLGYGLESFGILRCDSNPHLCCFENMIFAIFCYSSIQKYSFETRHWADTSSVYYSAIDIISVVFGSKIVLSAQNRFSLDAYSPIEDRMFELAKGSYLKDTQKIMFLNGNKVLLVYNDQIIEYDLKTSQFEQKIIKNQIFSNLITAPVCHKGKFYVVNAENTNIGIFDPLESTFFTINIREKLANINYIYNFL